ncbi:MAG: response regulator [Thermodesulfobacteriota bacterium]
MALASEKTILVVDDEPDVRNFLAAFLSDAGFTVKTAHDGVDALEKAFADPPDLITLDMVMPRQSGTRVMRELKKNEKTASIPVIVITAHARDELGSDEIKELNAFTAHLRPKYVMEKPVTPEKLTRSIAEILGVELMEGGKQEVGKDQEIISKLISGADPDTLAKIKQMLAKQ